MRVLKNGEVVSGALLAALGVYIVVQARQWEYLGPDGPGPGFFPLWYGIALVALSLVLIGLSLRGSTTAEAPKEESGTARALAAWAALVACVGLLKPLGFLAAFALFTLFLVRFLYRQSWGRALAVAIGGAAGFYLVFDLALNVALPTGVLGF